MFESRPGFMILALTLVVAAGCNNPPQYKYQEQGDIKQSMKSSEEQTVKHNNPAVADTAGNPEPAAPLVPEITVGDLLNSGKVNDGKRIKVTGRKGKIQDYYSLGFLISNNSDRYITFKYDQIPAESVNPLKNASIMHPVSVTGTWDSSKKILNSDEVLVLK